MKILGIDPGILGGYAIVEEGAPIIHQKFTTEGDMAHFVRDNMPDFCFLEEVHSMPEQGVVGVFTFGTNYGFHRGLLFALNIPFSTVTPQKWQREMRCLTKGNKNISKAKAQELYPSIKMTHAIADAYLIATYGDLIKRGSTPRPPSFRGTSYFGDFLT